MLLKYNMEKKIFNSDKRQEKDFQNKLDQVNQIKSYQMSIEQKNFDNLPDFYKEGLYKYSYLKNIYKQSYIIKKYTYEAMQLKGLQHIKFKEYENALEQFIKSICIFKYIECLNPKWSSGDRIKDNELKYIEDKGNNEVEKKEIIKMIKSSLLNISFVYLILKDYKNVRDACNEILKIDPRCVKAYYRMAKSYIDDPKSLINGHIEAQKLLETAYRIAPDNIEIRSSLELFNKQINDEKKSEPKIYRSNYNIINKETKKPEKLEKEKNEEEKKNKEDKNNGMSQIRMMNLILEICYNQKGLYERQDMKKEIKKLEKIIKQANKYREDLNDLINLDFNNPNEKIINLSKKKGFDLKDQNIQKYFNDLKLKLIEEINIFLEKNVKLMKEYNNKNIKTYNELIGKINNNNDNTFSNEEDAGNNGEKKEKDKINNILKRNININEEECMKNKNVYKNEKIKDEKDKYNIIKNNEQLKNTIKLAFSGIFIFLCFYLLKFGLGYYLRNTMDINI